MREKKKFEGERKTVGEKKRVFSLTTIKRTKKKRERAASNVEENEKMNKGRKETRMKHEREASAAKNKDTDAVLRRKEKISERGKPYVRSLG